MQCKNCDTILTKEMDYCASCGGKVIRNRLAMRNLFEHFSETFFNYDNKFIQTFIHLFKCPEVVIGGYIDGTRKKHVNVISYFAIALTLSGIQIFILNKFFPEAMDIDVMFSNETKEIGRKSMSFTQEYQSIIYMMFVPLYALISKIVFLNKKTYNYTEHVVINMYLLAHFSILSSITTLFTTFVGINFGLSALVILPMQTLYSAYAFKRLYNLSLGSIILKYLLFLIISMIIFIILSIFYAIVMYMNGDLQEAYQRGKASSGS